MVSPVYASIKTNESMFPLGTKMRGMLLMNIEIPPSTRLLRYHSLFNGQLPLKNLGIHISVACK